MDKGLARLSIVQAIIADFVSCQQEDDAQYLKVQSFAQTIKEKIPSLLASRHGLSVACAFFSILDAKDRKIVVKSLPVAEMMTNKIAHLFLIHIITTLDDTQLTKKKILHEAMKLIDDQVADRQFQLVLLSALLPIEVLNKKFLTADETASMQLCKARSSSKKDNKIRWAELVKVVQKPLEIFFEEKLQYYLVEINQNTVLKSLCTAIVQNGSIGESDLMDELMRRVQQKTANDVNTPTEKYMMIGHQDVHRLLKDLVTAECEVVKEKADFELKYSQQMAKILLKNFDDAITTRAVFILICLIENEATKPLVTKQLKAKKSAIEAEFKKSGGKSAGLRILLKNLK